MLDIEVQLFSDGFNRVQAVRPHRDPPKIDQKVAPLEKKLLYFYKAAPGHRWHVKKLKKN